MAESDQAEVETLDVCGKPLPYPLYLTKKKMGLLEPGHTLRVLCDTPESAEDSIPRCAANMGCRIETLKLADKWELLIKKA
jgi:TusA-related sulfurtransferase